MSSDSDSEYEHQQFRRRNKQLVISDSDDDEPIMQTPTQSESFTVRREKHVTSDSDTDEEVAISSGSEESLSPFRRGKQIISDSDTEEETVPASSKDSASSVNVCAQAAVDTSSDVYIIDSTDEDEDDARIPAKERAQQKEHLHVSNADSVSDTDDKDKSPSSCGNLVRQPLVVGAGAAKTDCASKQRSSSDVENRDPSENVEGALHKLHNKDGRISKSVSPQLHEQTGSKPKFESALELSSLSNLKDQLNKKMKIYNSVCNSLPDRGQRLWDQIAVLQAAVEKKEVEAANTMDKEPVSQDVLPMSSGVQQEKSGIRVVPPTVGASYRTNLEALYAANPHYNQLYGGRMNDARKLEVRTVTSDAVSTLHKSLKGCPAEDVEIATPPAIKVELMQHQRHGLAWMLWRETQHPPGGILADDMGLGKTLSMLALILQDRQQKTDTPDDEDGDSKWMGKNVVKCDGTLVVCPASLLAQWENEAKEKCRRGALNVLVYHGASRNKDIRFLHRYDLVITTYQVIQREIGDTEFSADRTPALLKTGWNRIILDEGHVIRNPKSKTSVAVCRLRAGRRWVVTGTPIHNKELDMYSLLRFLRCSPFDELKVWKLWVDNKSAQGVKRLNLLVKSLMLRRTKDQTNTVTGQQMVTLPDKHSHMHIIELTKEEREIYMRVLSFSQAVLMNYLKKKEECDEELQYRTGYRPAQPSGAAMPTSFKQPQGEVKAHHILTLLLRLRQICNHPSLIKAMLTSEEKQNEGLEDDMDLISQMESMSLEKSGNDVDNVLLASNPVYDQQKASSKIGRIIEEISQLQESHRGEKIVVVSQWTSMLDIMQGHLHDIGFDCHAINGKVDVKDRGGIVADFNGNPSGPQIMLLSLGAGGVGLNLVGANHLFMVDLHWNPQLEAQACDRIYRVGQKREVHVHRFICKDSVEEKICELQNNKLKLANDVLTGAKRTAASKLTLQDLKLLFDVPDNRNQM